MFIIYDSVTPTAVFVCFFFSGPLWHFGALCGIGVNRCTQQRSNGIHGSSVQMLVFQHCKIYVDGIELFAQYLRLWLPLSSPKTLRRLSTRRVSRRRHPIKTPS